MLKLRFVNRERTEIIWKTDPSEIENLQYKKTTDCFIESVHEN